MFSLYCKNVAVPLLLRLALAVIFIYHGLDLVSPEKGWGTRSMPDQPVPVQVAVAWGELLGGIALGLGFLTRLAALGIIAIMAGAIATVHWPHGFSIQAHGYEYNFAIIVMCLCLILGGPGPFAVDRFFKLRRRKQP
jgi:putative oxidoreductase